MWMVTSNCFIRLLATFTDSSTVDKYIEQKTYSDVVSSSMVVIQSKLTIYYCGHATHSPHIGYKY